MERHFIITLMLVALLVAACGQNGDVRAPLPPTSDHHLTDERPSADRSLERGAEEDRVWDLYHRAIPDLWEQRIYPAIYGIDGYTSYAYTPRTIYLAEYHLRSSDQYLSVIIAHEYGHLIAFRYGTQEYLGAPPRGWPPRTDRPEEHWADCVQQVFLNVVDPTPGLPPCEGAQLQWARDWLAR